MNDMNAFGDPVEAPVNAFGDPVDESGDMGARASINQAVKADPDRSARAARVARDTGLPAGVVERNLEYVERQRRAREIEQQAQASPALARVLADPATAKVAHDDAENLGVVERLLGAARRGWESFRQGHAGTAIGSNARTLANIDDVERRMAAGENIADGEDWLGVRFMSAEERAALRSQLQASIASGAGSIAEREVTKRATAQPAPEVRAAQAAKDFGTFWEEFKKNPLEFIATVGLESLPSSAPGIAALAAGPVVGAAGMGAASYAADYAGSILSALAEEGVDLADQDAILRAVRDPVLMARIGRKAAAHAVATATLDAASGGLAGKTLSTSRVGNIAAQALAQGSLGAAGEVAGSVAAGDNLHAGNIAGEFFGEFAFSPVEVASASAGAVVDARRARAAQVQENGQALGAAVEAARGSKLNERDSALLARFANDAAAGESIFIDARTLGQAAQAAGVDLAQVAQSVPSLAEQLQQAEATGADVEISVGDAVAHLQPLASTLVEHARIGSPEAPTIAESYSQEDRGAQVARELSAAALDEAASAAATVQAATLQDRIESDIAATGRFAGDVGTQYASLASAFYTTQAQRLGMDPGEFYARFGARIASSIGAVPTLDQNTPEFRAWFGDSKVVDETGAPLRVYHGTGKDFPAFDAGQIERPGFGYGFHFAEDAPVANFYAEQWQSGERQSGDNVLPVHLSIRNPFTGNYYELLAALGSHQKVREALIAEGYDGIRYQHDAQGEGGAARFAWVAFHPEQIKSVFNRGTFDPNDPNILNQGRRGAYDPATRTIALLQAADLSTFLHESAHHYLEVMIATADESTAVAGDLKAIFDYLGTTREAWSTMSLEEKRPYHETFARSFEAYLFEGRAPSPQLQGVFARFRSWLLEVYKTLAALQVELRPEIREVFDRMLATDEQIAARSLPALDLGEMLDPVEAAQYQAEQAQASVGAVADFEAKALRDLGRTRRAHGRQMQRIRAQMAEARNLIEAQVSLEVAQEPVFMARAALAAAGAEGKLNAQALADLYGSPESVYGRFDWSSIRHLAADTGQHPDIVAESFGFQSGDQLARALVEAGDPAAHVEALTDRRMLEQFGELVTDDGIARAADAAVANEHTGRVLLMAANALRRATGSKPILQGQAREVARTALAGHRLRTIKPAQFRMAAAKSQRLAAEAQARGRIAEAAGHARNALLAHEYHREAIRIAEEAVKAHAYLSKFTSEGVRKSLSRDYLGQIDQILDKLDLRKLTDREIDRATSLREWIAAQEEAGLAPSIDADLVERAMAQPLRDLTVEQMRGIVDTVKQVEHLARLKQKLLTAADQRSFDTVAEELAATIRANSGEAKAIEMDRGRWDRLAGKVRSYFAEHRKFASLARQMDGGADAGPMWRALVRPMNDAGNAEAAMRMQATEALTEILKPVEALPGGLGQKVHIAEIGRSLSRQARLAVALNMGNETNRARVMAGENWSAAQVGAILKTLTATEWRTVQSLWAYLDSYWPAIVAKEMRVTGTAPERVQPAPFAIRSADGVEMQLSGGYYPISFDTLRDDVAQSHDQAAAAKEMLQAAYTRSTTRRGHTKKRVEKVQRAMDLSMQPLFKHLTQVTHDLTHHEWLIDATRLLRDERVASAIREHYGAEVLKAMRDTVRDVAVGDVPSAGAAEHMVARLRRNTTAAVLGWSMTTSLLQPFGLAQSIVRIGPQWVFKGMARWGGDAARMRNSMRWIGEKSSFMKLRGRTMLREMNEVSARIVGGQSAKAQAWEAAKFVFMQKMQLVADVPTWIGAYEKALAEGRAEAEAVALADQAVIDSQGSGMTKDQAGVQRGGEMAKALSMFYSYFSTTWNLLAEEHAKLDGRSALSLAKYSANVALLVVIPAIGPAMLTEALKGGDDWDDPEKMARKLFEWQVSYLLGLLVGVRELGALAQGFDYRGPAAFRPVVDLGNLVAQIRQGEVDGPAIRAAISTLGSVFGIPSTQINRSIRGWEAFMEGDAPASAVLFGPPPKE